MLIQYGTRVFLSAVNSSIFLNIGRVKTTFLVLQINFCPYFLYVLCDGREI
jgi:hypothetical protein